MSAFKILRRSCAELKERVGGDPWRYNGGIVAAVAPETPVRPKTTDAGACRLTTAARSNFLKAPS